MSKTPAIRFAFDVVEGPNAGLTTGSWSVMIHGDSVYIFSPELAKDWKVSLHADSLWMLAVTDESLKSGRHILPRGGGRAPWKFKPTPFKDGGRLAFAIAASRSSLLRRERRAGISVPVADRWDELTVASIWMTEPDVDAQMTGLIAPHLTMKDGRRIWVTAKAEPWEREDATLFYRGSVLEPWWPERHGVDAPGIVIRGAVIDTTPSSSEDASISDAGVSEISQIIFQPIDIRDLLDESGQIRADLRG